MLYERTPSKATLIRKSKSVTLHLSNRVQCLASKYKKIRWLYATEEKKLLLSERDCTMIYTFACSKYPMEIYGLPIQEIPQ